MEVNYMAKKMGLILFFILFASKVIADEPGDILLVAYWGEYIINVDYTTMTKSKGKRINGRAGEDGWIRFNESMTDDYILYLDFDSFSWDWAGNEEDVENMIKLLEGEYTIMYAVEDRYTHMVEVELEAGEKYIIMVEFQQYGISE
jgi:hypothetical protein